ncbi:unnamed protein product [Microthlaspi erraticum]|uniref:Uncharacterized protein n=1 Tax=Microthlaspi erraticum TaxID=1685480 RepID=A0A6D2LLV8_9BRAS|nr:unnamed protein product [Microthlaspi erraticum]
MADSKIVPESFNSRSTDQPAGWAEIVSAIHRVMVAFYMGILLIIYSRKMVFGAAAGAPVPVEMVPVLAWIGSGWAGSFILAKAARGYGTGKVMDCISIASALALVGFLIYYVIGAVETIVGGVACLLVAAGLFCMRDW